MSELHHVLIVEDDVGIREALAECVASLGLDVATAVDGLEGLAKLRGGPRPDAILLDLRMPRLDGHGFLEALTGDPSLATIPVVAMTAWLDQPRVPVHAFLRKPFDLDELAHVLEGIGSPPSGAAAP